MTDYIEKLLDFYIVSKRHHKYRTVNPEKYSLAEGYAAAGMEDSERAVKRLVWMLENERPVVFTGEKIALIRTVSSVPEIFTEDEFNELGKKHWIHEQGKVCNINPDYGLLINSGTRAKRAEILERRARFENEGDTAKARFLDSELAVIDALEAFAEKYRLEAVRAGNGEVAHSFERIPYERPETLLQALQFLRLIHYCLWCSFNYHNTFGRFDQYMYPYYLRDIQNGVLDDAGALELVEEFFISCNKDSDLYPGMQQGDNGQSMVLAASPDGTESYNSLSGLCMDACLDLKLIDPKINLRVNKNTPLPLYEKGSVMTRQGLGFPQYANDDIVIEALENWGYAKKDAYNYVVAACWEFIIPGVGMDIPNANGLSFTSIHQV
jgi:formate C-acetyltransferase